MSLMDVLLAGMLALFLTVPLGPVGFGAAERLMRGYGRDFRLIAAGTVSATVLLVSVALILVAEVPAFEPAWFEGLGVVWVILGILLMGLGAYLWEQLPKRSRGRKPRRGPFWFGFGVTLLWPTNLVGMVGVLMAFQLAGWLPGELGGKALLVGLLGGLAAVLWLGWGWLCGLLLRQEKWDLARLATFFQRCMAGSLVLGGVLLVLKPLGF